jgi:hypothetical protein
MMFHSKFVFGLTLLISVCGAPAAHAAFVNSTHACNPNYAITEAQLVASVDTLEDNSTTIGYNIVESVFDLRVRGCGTVSVSADVSKLYCGNEQIGTLTRTRADQAMPTFKIQFNPRHDFEIVGSCDRREGRPLTLIVK